MQVTPDELAMMLGAKDIEIFALQKQIAVLNAELAKLKPKTKEPAACRSDEQLQQA